jgi:hypothetical protein
MGGKRVGSWEQIQWVHHVEEQHISNTLSKNFTYLFTIRTAHRPDIGVARLVQTPRAITSSYQNISGRRSRHNISGRISHCSISRCSISRFTFAIRQFRWALCAIFRVSWGRKRVCLGSQFSEYISTSCWRTKYIKYTVQEFHLPLHHSYSTQASHWRSKNSPVPTCNN